MDSYISLNVGGRIYQTSKQTLSREPESFFILMLTSRIAPVKDSKGRYMIDRDGETFRHVLNYMRLGKLVLPDGYKELELLQEEADFFQLDSMKKDIQTLLAGSNASANLPSMIVTLDVGGRLFHTTRKTLAREPQSFFSAMLDDETLTPKDMHGTYMIDRNGEKFKDVLEYMRLGIILHDSPNRLDMLRSEAAYFRLKILMEHTKSICRLKESLSPNLPHVKMIITPSLDLYYSLSSRFCVIYTNNKNVIGSKCILPMAMNDFYTTCGNIFVTSFILDRSKAGTPTEERHTIAGFGKSTVNYPSTKEELMTYIGHRTQMWNYKKTQINADCYRFSL